MNSEQFKRTQQDVADAITVAYLSGIVRDTIRSIQNGVWADTELVWFGMTVGHLKTIPNWSTDPQYICHIVAAAVGRSLRFIIQKTASRGRLTQDQLLELIKSTDAVEQQVIQRICIN